MRKAPCSFYPPLFTFAAAMEAWRAKDLGVGAPIADTPELAAMIDCIRTGKLSTRDRGSAATAKRPR
jgi:hypothetical protein